MNSDTVQEQSHLPAFGVGVGGDSNAPTPGDILAMLRRRLVMVIVLTIFFSTLAVGGFAVWWRVFPGFRGEALIECISNIPETALSTDQGRLKQEEHERFVLSQAVLLKSPTVLGEALKVTTVRQTEWYHRVPPGKHLLDLTKELSAVPLRGTNFLKVTMTCRDRKDPAIVINEVVSQWLSTVKRRSADLFASKAIEGAQEEQTNLLRKIESKRKSLAALAAQLPAGAIANPADNIVAQQVKQYGEQVARLRLELSQLEQFRALYNDPNGPPVTAQDLFFVEQDPQVAQLSGSLLLLEQAQAADLKVYGPEHNVIKQVDAQVEATKEKLTEKRIEVWAKLRAGKQEDINSAYANVQHSWLLAQENLAKKEGELHDQDEKVRLYQDLEADVERDLEHAVELEKFIADRNRVVQQQTAVNVNIAQPATEPLRQDTPNIWLLPFGLFAAFVVSLAIPLALELLNKSVRTTRDIVRHIDIAVLGAVPDADDEEVSIRQIEMAVRDAPRSIIAEAFRRIRTNLQFSSPAERQRSIVISSPRPEDGKTTIACNLATALAQGGRRILLVDANFRRPSLHQLFEACRGAGLSNILVGQASLSSTVRTTDQQNLYVLGAGPVPPNPAELLGSDACAALLDEAIAEYDQVLIDTAPVLLASDALVLSTIVDGTILVVRARANTRGAVQRACHLLTDVGAHLFGSILNAAQVTGGGYFREQLRTYYDYQVDADTSAPALPPSNGDD